MFLDCKIDIVQKLQNFLTVHTQELFLLIYFVQSSVHRWMIVAKVFYL